MGCKPGWTGSLCTDPSGLSVPWIVVMAVCGLVILLMVCVFVSCCCRKKPDDGKGKYKSANTPLRRWGTVVRAHTQPASSQRDRTNGHVTDRYMDVDM